jgi:DNA-binding transcriptional regulator GbsR (MarR family)
VKPQPSNAADDAARAERNGTPPAADAHPPATPDDGSDPSAFDLPEDAPIRRAQDEFIKTWGGMGSAWGISRTMAEVHALLYITGEPLCTDDVMARLDISRGNASMTLRSLTDWGIVHRQHKRGDRKEYFVAEQDIWAMFMTIARERKKRELDPVVASLYDIRDSTDAKRPASKQSDPHLLDEHNRRLDEMLDFFRKVDRLSGAVIGRNGSGLQAALALLGKLG